MSYTSAEYKYGAWLIFGEHPDGYVDIQSEPSGQTVVTHIARSEAQTLIDQHQEMLDALDAIPSNLGNS